MAKFALKAQPTFTAKVGFPQAGGEAVDVLLTFKHRTKTGLDEFLASRADRTDVDSFMEMVVGWELADEFSKENIELLLENHIGVALATYKTYIDQLVQHRAKN
ncbi:MAG: hypothetical protein EOP24_26340 [Hyphomicrobiales bacterium]|nr:MAG: hypothetical protein EOP24_26340 [Hyphomicrobiales bacterium]